MCKERSPAQKLRDRQRCELAKSKVCKCQCNGVCHGSQRAKDHEILDLQGVKSEVFYDKTFRPLPEYEPSSVVYNENDIPF